MEEESVLPNQRKVTINNEIPSSVCREMEDAMDDSGTASSVNDASTSTTLAQRPVLSGGSSFLSETPISIFQASDHSYKAPKKSAFYVCRFQQPPQEILCVEWSLEGSGMFSTWGYIFE